MKITNFTTGQDITSIIGDKPKLTMRVNISKVKDTINWAQISRDEVPFISESIQYKFIASELKAKFFNTDTIPTKILVDLGSRTLLLYLKRSSVGQYITDVDYHSILTYYNTQITQDNIWVNAPLGWDDSGFRNRLISGVDYRDTKSALNTWFADEYPTATLQQIRNFSRGMDNLESAMDDSDYPLNLRCQNMIREAWKNETDIVYEWKYDENNINFTTELPSLYFDIDGETINKLYYYLPKNIISKKDINDSYEMVDSSIKIDSKTYLDLYQQAGYIIREDTYSGGKMNYTISDELSVNELVISQDIYPTSLKENRLLFEGFQVPNLHDTIEFNNKTYIINKITVDLLKMAFKGEAICLEDEPEQNQINGMVK